MKKILFIFINICLALSLTACGPNADGVSKSVQASMQEKFNTDADLKEFNLKVKSAQFVKESDKKFKGIVTVEAADGTHDVIVTAIADGDNVVWEAEQSSFGFLAALKLNESLKQLQNLLKGFGTQN
jgi:hypothetical protein